MELGPGTGPKKAKTVIEGWSRLNWDVTAMMEKMQRPSRMEKFHTYVAGYTWLPESQGLETVLS